MLKVFNTEKRAQAFIDALKAQGIEAELWKEKDYLNKGRTIYTVRW